MEPCRIFGTQMGDGRVICCSDCLYKNKCDPNVKIETQKQARLRLPLSEVVRRLKIYNAKNPDKPIKKGCVLSALEKGILK